MKNNFKINKKFDPNSIESYWNLEWERLGLYRLNFNKKNECFSINLPPPNITGSLHMGHAFNQTIIDILIRFNKMNGKNTLFIPGTDHAGIATQIVVERQLELEGISKNIIGDNEFLNRIWQWQKNYKSKISFQLKRLGSLANWSYEYFTMDQKMSCAVQEAFICLYQEGLIYRGKRLINWDPFLRTALSDLEVIKKEENDFLWYIKYPINKNKYLTISTTRPETIFGDTAIMVHPEDDRYINLIGSFVKVPLINRKIPIISDRNVNINFGTGVVRVTPAHDFNDYNIALRHKLPMIEVFNIFGKINQNFPLMYQNLDRLSAKDKIIYDLKSYGFLSSCIPYRSMISRSERTGNIIEPMLTDQWFVSVNKKIKNNKMYLNKSLSDIAKELVNSGKIKFIPKNWTNIYYKWLEDIQDWCISRQLLWGHKIPAWHGKNGEIFIAKNEYDAYIQAKKIGYIDELKQDNDVLDTWFSSSIIPFSSLGWPNKTNEYDNFFPSSVLVTGYDIIFFWVTRMIMMSAFLTKKIPFKTVYVHGLIRDSYGNKMSKSTGNTIDPIDIISGIDINSLVAKRISGLINPDNARIIEKNTRKEFSKGISAFGADALRFTMASISTFSKNINFDLARCEGYRSFCNKLWNAANFVLLYCNKKGFKSNNYSYIHYFSKNRIDSSINYNNFSYADKWIISALQYVIFDVNKYFLKFRFDGIANIIYKFIWNQYCDWYLEFSKVQIKYGTIDQQYATLYVLLYVLESVLRILHPIMPFITEEIWQKISFFTNAYSKNLNNNIISIILQKYPLADKNKIHKKSENYILEFKSIINECRNLRNKNKISFSKSVNLIAIGDIKKLKEFSLYIKSFANIDNIKIIDDPVLFDKETYNLFVSIYEDNKFALNIKNDITINRDYLYKEIKDTISKISICNKRLGNNDFIKKAPITIVENERKKLEKYKIILVNLEVKLSQISI